MSAVVAHVETVAQSRVLVAVDELQVLQNEKQVCIKNALKLRKRFDGVRFREGLKATGGLGLHLFGGFAELVKANFFNFAVDARNRRTPPQDDTRT